MPSTFPGYQMLSGACGSRKSLTSITLSSPKVFTERTLCAKLAVSNPRNNRNCSHVVKDVHSGEILEKHARRQRNEDTALSQFAE